MAYITEYPILTTPSNIVMYGNESYEDGLDVIVMLDGRLWRMIRSPYTGGRTFGWFEADTEATSPDPEEYRKLCAAYAAFERGRFEMEMVAAGATVTPLMEGVL